MRTLVAGLAEKVSLSTETLDGQAIGNALFGKKSWDMGHQCNACTR